MVPTPRGTDERNSFFDHTRSIALEPSVHV
jgi:hypothetical protein